MGGVVILNWETPQDVPQINNYHFYGVYYVPYSLLSILNLINPTITLFLKELSLSHFIEKAGAEILERLNLAKITQWPESVVLISMHTTITKCLPEYRPSFSSSS